MQKNILETLMGAVVLIVAVSFLVFAYEGSQMHTENGYTVNGRFSNATGISLGSDVRIGGIKIGVISGMTLDPNSFEAVVAMNIKNAIKIPKDSSAAIVSSGLLGDKFIQLAPGNDDKMLGDGGRILYTQSAVNLEEMIGKFMFSGGGVDKDKDKKAPAPDAAAPAPAPQPAAKP